MKPLFGSANHSRAFNLHFVQINDRIQDNFTPFVRKFSKGNKFTLVEYQRNCMEINLSDRTNNVRVIKYFNLQLVVLSTNKVWERYKKSECDTYCD
jgi:hypothetical protein